MIRTLIQIKKFKETWIVADTSDSSSSGMGYYGTPKILKEFATKKEAEDYKKELDSKNTGSNYSPYRSYMTSVKRILISEDEYYE